MDKTILEHIGKACSKDDARYQLTGIYRDTDCFVATDGYRLHYINGQEKIEKGYYLNGTDATFPDWKQILPNPQNRTSFGIFITKHDLKCLKNMLKFLQGLTEYKSDRMTQSIVVMSCEKLDNGTFLVLETKSINYRIRIDDQGNIFKGKKGKIGIQLQYLIDAVETPILNSTLKDREGFSINIGTDQDPILITQVAGYFGTALIMPVRL